MLRVSNLRKHFRIEAGMFGKETKILRAVDGVNFDVRKGETLGLVGESGCGKTTLGLTLLRLYEPTSGEAYFEGKRIFQLKGKEMLKFRREMQMIFQDPQSSLNPRMAVFNIIGEAFDIHGHARGDEKRKRIMELMEIVGLAGYQIHKYPHQFSGGERQRIGIARALAVGPKFIVADEPVSALDVSVRAQILNLLRDLKEEYKLTVLFISHDLSVVRHMCDRIAVMYLGKLVELAAKNDLFNSPQHPYTQALLSAIPIPDPEAKRKRIILKGGVPTPINPPSGCPFHPRCQYAEPTCAEAEPEFTNVGSPKQPHYVACNPKK